MMQYVLTAVQKYLKRVLNENIRLLKLKMSNVWRHQTEQGIGVEIILYTEPE